ncbi:helix-turn-helix transcriptional regulator [Pseudomonas chlororaphis]|uniref:LuxR family transcriptional regulator n=1 Tax=Pseudomonas chlororaphis TaxID=587753 RepID=A0A1Q8EP04_9PSED|nr:helix-turn-helix transcriptional regulator [Pseudomonas chlororaphis]OLF53505.1 LuxR family transcriptional regulator [Pseudomonas chlororaphis]
MNSQLLFPHIGKVIASTGSRSFPRRLHDLIRTQLAVDATHITQRPAYAQGPSQPGPAHDEVYSDAAHEPCDTGAAQLHLTGHKDDYRYGISVYRSCQSQSFSPQERILLQDFSPLLLPMVEKHLTALQPLDAMADHAAGASLERQGLETLRLRFAARLRQSGLKLSDREMQVCVGLLAGRTAPELAVQLRLKVHTVESYLKRAAIKLGISGRHSLLRWMYSPDEAGAATGPGTGL